MEFAAELGEEVDVFFQGGSGIKNLKFSVFKQ